MIQFINMFEGELLSYNRGYKIDFNSYSGHTLEDKLNRVDISLIRLKADLKKIISKIKQLKLSSGNYSFNLTDYKIPIILNQKKKSLFITTLLTKNMISKSIDKKIIVEGIEYINIEME